MIEISSGPFQELHLRFNLNNTSDLFLILMDLWPNTMISFRLKQMAISANYFHSRKWNLRTELLTGQGSESDSIITKVLNHSSIITCMIYFKNIKYVDSRKNLVFAKYHFKIIQIIIQIKIQPVLFSFLFYDFVLKIYHIYGKNYRIIN